MRRRFDGSTDGQVFEGSTGGRALDSSANESALFVQMAQEYPVRTAVFTFGLPVFSLSQVVNGYVNEGSLALIGAFALLTVAFSFHLTRYQMAVYRRRAVTRRFL
jgi:predicted permease